MRASQKELFYDKFSDVWESKINKTETRKRLSVVFEDLLKGVDLKGKQFLDVGCGLGYFSKEASRRGAIVTGVDVGGRLVKKSKQRVPEGNFIVASASELPFKDETFDIVLCTEVIEHLENQKEALAEIFRALKKGGVLVLTTPNRIYKPLFDFLSIVGVRSYRGNENWYFLSVLRRILGKKGKILKERYFNFFIPMSLFNRLERFNQLRNFMINQGYLVEKI